MEERHEIKNLRCSISFPSFSFFRREGKKSRISLEAFPQLHYKFNLRDLPDLSSPPRIQPLHLLELISLLGKIFTETFLSFLPWKKNHIHRQWKRFSSFGMSRERINFKHFSFCTPSSRPQDI
jgi:hypothetical protein